MITKIATIKNIAVFKDFDWDLSVRNRDNRPVHFKPVNIIYGRNYTGKTTLSRILRAIETGELSDKYKDPVFKIEFTDGAIVDQASPKDHPYTVRVFNEDFVRSHLRVFFDEDDEIAAFAVLGEDNAELAERLQAKETELGSEDTPGSLLSVEADCRREWVEAKNNHRTAFENLDNQLRKKANAESDGIKHNRLYGDPNYDITKIKEDIETVRAKGYISLQNTRADKLKTLLTETPKDEIPDCARLSLRYETILEEGQELAQRQITVSGPIQDLLDDALLQEWVRAGRKHHENKRETCGFCGSRLPDNLWSKLDSHFNKESEKLREEISSLMDRTEKESERASSLMSVDVSAFYGVFATQARDLASKVATIMGAYKAGLADVKKALKQRQNDIFEASSIPDMQNVSPALEALRDEYENLRAQGNDYTSSLNEEQAAARTLLRLHEVASFISTIDYESQRSKITDVKGKVIVEKRELDSATATVSGARDAIAVLKAEMKDERNGAERVND